jgi:hypothetical protein
MKLLSKIVLLATCFSLMPSIAMTEIDTDNGSPGHFEWLTKSDGPIEFDKSISADAIVADKFTTLQTHVIVYYCGEGDVRTLVALHDLGAGPLANSTGTVVKLDRHEHLLTIKNSKGGEESFHLDPKTVVDTEVGVATNYKFDLSMGTQVRVLATQANGSQTALLITPDF